MHSTHVRVEKSAGFLHTVVQPSSCNSILLPPFQPSVLATSTITPKRTADCLYTSTDGTFQVVNVLSSDSCTRISLSVVSAGEAEPVLVSHQISSPGTKLPNPARVPCGASCALGMTRQSPCISFLSLPWKGDGIVRWRLSVLFIPAIQYSR